MLILFRFLRSILSFVLIFFSGTLVDPIHGSLAVDKSLSFSFWAEYEWWWGFISLEPIFVTTSSYLWSLCRTPGLSSTECEADGLLVLGWTPFPFSRESSWSYFISMFIWRSFLPKPAVDPFRWSSSDYGVWVSGALCGRPGWPLGPTPS